MIINTGQRIDIPAFYSDYQLSLCLDSSDLSGSAGPSFGN